jgi:hypothetical protein
MGLPFSRVKRVQVAARREKANLASLINERRRNSLAYNVKKYVELNGGKAQ